jgi:hypothetical protein
MLLKVPVTTPLTVATTLGISGDTSIRDNVVGGQVAHAGKWPTSKIGKIAP